MSRMPQILLVEDDAEISRMLSRFLVENGLRVLIAGDTHGNTKWVKHLIDAAARNDCPVIIQVGDFGYFPDHRDGPRFLSAVDQACAANGVELWFIDGNHDDHTSLVELEHGHIPVDVAEHVTYLPRGRRLHLGGRRFGFLGGAFSVDWRDRTAGIDWWHHEVTDTDDVARLGTEQLDVLITHDAPAGVALLSSWRLPAEDQVRADDVRALVAQATASTSPQLLVHGHWHHGYESELDWIDRATTDRTGALTWGSTRVVGLGCDGDAERGWIILDLPTLDITWPIADE